MAKNETTASLTHLDPIGCGRFSNYFRMSNGIGAKVLRPCYDDVDKARTELAILHRAEPSGITPIPIGVIKVEYRYRHRIEDRSYLPDGRERKNGEFVADGAITTGWAIMMQHLDYPTLSAYADEIGEDRESLKIDNEYPDDIAYRALQDVGISANDLHSENILIGTDKNGFESVYVIDFSPDFTDSNENESSDYSDDRESSYYSAPCKCKDDRLQFPKNCDFPLPENLATMMTITIDASLGELKQENDCFRFWLHRDVHNQPIVIIQEKLDKKENGFSNSNYFPVAEYSILSDASDEFYCEDCGNTIGKSN